MRIAYSNLELAKSAAKKVAAITNLSLAKCQTALAVASGYADWHELESERSPQSGPSAVDLDLDALAGLISRLASRLDAPAGDIQHALSHSPIVPQDRFSLLDRVSLRALVYRLMEIPDLGRRQPGAVGKFKYDGRPLILKQFSDVAWCVSDGSPTIFMADFEYVTPRVPIPLFIPRRLYLPYGAWTEKDGSKVLFSRDYLPIWRIRPESRPERVSPRLWIDFVEQEWFWEEHNAPWEREAVFRCEVHRLRSFGVRGLPKLVEVLPRLVLQYGDQQIGDVAKEQFGPWIYQRQLVDA